MNTSRCSQERSLAVLTSVAVLAETLLRSPQKLFIFIIKKIFIGAKYPKNKLFNLKQTSLVLTSFKQKRSCRSKQSCYLERGIEKRETEKA